MTTPREQYESFMKERLVMGFDIRMKLVECFKEQAERAIQERRWEAASAFQYCAEVALGYVTKIESK